MDNPRRLLDGSGTELEQRLLEELRSYRGSHGMRKRTLAALGLIGSAGLSMAGVLAWGRTSGAKLLLSVSMASALVAVPTAYFWSRQHETSPPPTVTRSRAIAPSPAFATGPASSAPAAAVSLPAVSTPAVSSPALVVRSARRGTTSSPPLRAEVDALDAVRASLVRRDFPGALSLLAAYFRTFRHGRLQVEAEVLRIDALARAGFGDAARAQAKDFLRRNPKSVHCARLQSILEK